MVEDVHELPVTSRPGAQLFLHLAQRWRQRPILERRAIAQCARLLLQRGNIVPRVEKGPIALEAANVFANNSAVGHHHDAFGIGAQRHRLAGIAAVDAVTITISVCLIR